MFNYVSQSFQSAVDPEEGEMFEFEAFASTHFQGGESHRCVTRLLRRPLLEHDNVNDQKVCVFVYIWLHLYLYLENRFNKTPIQIG